RRELRTVREQGEPVWSVAWGADGKTLAWAAGRGRSEVVLWDVAGGKERGRFQGHPAGVRCLALTADGMTLATGSTDGIVRLWDAGSGKERVEFRKRREKADHPLGVSSLAFSSDGSQLASGGVDGTAKLWDLSRGDARATLDRSVFTSEVRSVAFAPDGKTVAVARVDGLVLLWDPARLTSPILKSLWPSVIPLATALDGKTLATAQERTVRLRELTSGRQGGVRRGEGGDKLCAAFSPDGKLLATGEGDHDRPGTVRLWDAITGAQLASLTPPLTLPSPPGGEGRVRGGRV